MSKHKPRSICMIIPTFYPVVGGTQSQVLSLCRKLLAAGWSVQVVTRQHSAHNPFDLPLQETVEGIPIRRIPSQGDELGSVRFLLGGLWYLLRHARGQVYHAHDIGAAGWMAVLARYLLRGHAIVKLRTGRLSYTRRMFASHLFAGHVSHVQFRLLLRLVDAVQVVSSEGERFTRDLGLAPQRILWLANAVDTQHYAPVGAAAKKHLRRVLELPQDKTIVLYVGRLEHVKGPDVLLAAWAALPDDLRRCAQLVLLGDGVAGDAFGQAILANTGASVSTLGMRRNVLEYYQAGDLLVLPSRAEGLSNSMLEAMACGLPVIASNVGGALDFITDGASGLLFESEDSGQLAHCLVTLLTEKQRWAAMGARARALVLEKADLATAVRRLEAIYEQHYSAAR